MTYIEQAADILTPFATVANGTVKWNMEAMSPEQVSYLEDLRRIGVLLNVAEVIAEREQPTTPSI